jgi:hypothetical protein
MWLRIVSGRDAAKKEIEEADKEDAKKGKRIGGVRVM